jgi:hypothetical protein
MILLGISNTILLIKNYPSLSKGHNLHLFQHFHIECIIWYMYLVIIALTCTKV